MRLGRSGLGPELILRPQHTALGHARLLMCLGKRAGGNVYTAKFLLIDTGIALYHVWAGGQDATQT